MGFYMECFLKGTLFWYGYDLWKIPLQNLKFSSAKDCFSAQLMLYSNQQTVQLRTQVAFSPLVPNCLP